MGESSPLNVDMQEKVNFLANPASFSVTLTHVEVRETHLSWVFFVGQVVYKLKKPIRTPYVDLTSVDNRKTNCEEEVQLNRRLAPQTYIGVARMTIGRDGALALDGSGTVVDWLVVMNRLPADRMLDCIIAEGPLADAECDRLSNVLGRFYASAIRADVEPEHHINLMRRIQAENRRVIFDVEPNTDVANAGRILDQLDQAMISLAPLVEQRVRDGRIVDGHGDLRPEHVCLTEPIAIFDCLEFSRLLRLVDPLDELAFLGMECSYLGCPRTGPALAARVLDRLDEVPNWPLFRFYCGSRAVLRARLSLAHLLDPAPREPERWGPQAQRYLNLAEGYLRGAT